MACRGHSQLIARLGGHLKALDRQIQGLEVQNQTWHRENAASKKLAKIPGIGPITASALVASIGDARNFENGRQLAPWKTLRCKRNNGSKLQGAPRRLLRQS